MIDRYIYFLNYILKRPRSSDCKSVQIKVLDDATLASERLSQPNYSKEVKAITVFIRAPRGQRWILDYLGDFSDLRITQHESHVLYGGTSYYRIEGNHVKATVVSTQGIWSIPLRYQGKSWYYICLHCHPEDTRFDSFPGYEIAPASCYIF